MPDPGDVVIADFPGAIGIKGRPAVVISTTLYHTHRPDVILGLLTTQIKRATAPTDYVLLDWAEAGLRRPTAFRSYLATIDRIGSVHVGRLTERDWLGVQAALARALAIPSLQNP
ncbi:MAG TPA: transcriptional regulator [Planctomycetales bacterium]|jgi:mRNA interferase MazF|nr:transcriptional regulator [Planctomycetales bacterium]